MQGGLVKPNGVTTSADKDITRNTREVLLLGAIAIEKTIIHIMRCPFRWTSRRLRKNYTA